MTRYLSKGHLCAKVRIETLPEDLKRMIIHLLDPFSFSVLLEVVPDFRPLAELLKKTKNSKITPIMAEWLGSAKSVPNPSTRRLDKIKLDDIVSCGDGRYLGFRSHGRSHQLYWSFKRSPNNQSWHANEWKSEAEDIGAGETMSVTMWPRRLGSSAFFNVPELLSPSVFDNGRLCLGYEKIEHGPWKLVVRQISDWRLVAQQSLSVTSDYADILGYDSDLVVQWSDSKIRLWNPRYNKLWELQHSEATDFNPPQILNGKIGFITTSKHASDYVHVLSWSSITWRDTEKQPHMAQQGFRLPASHFHRKISGNRETSSIVALESSKRIHRVSQNGISFLHPDHDLAVTYMGQPMEIDDLEIGVGEFSDGTKVIRTDDRYIGSRLKMVKNGKEIWRLDDSRECYGALIYLDAYLVLADRDRRQSFGCQVSFRKINGQLAGTFDLPWNYTGREIRIFEEGGGIIIFAGDLLEATVCKFFENTPSSTKRASEGEQRRVLRSHKKRRLPSSKS